jgi:hypothetical protein
MHNWIGLIVLGEIVGAMSLFLWRSKAEIWWRGDTGHEFLQQLVRV